MPALNTTFDATQVAPREAHSPIPAGEYLAMIVASEFKRTNKGDGQYLSLEFQVLEGEYQNRKFWDRLNLDNPNVQAVEIAQRTLSAICHATGKLQVTDSEALHNIPMVVKLAVTKSDRGENNEVKGYKSIAGKGVAAPVGATPPPAQRQAAPGNKPAWAR